jgi:biotin carboxylase
VGRTYPLASTAPENDLEALLRTRPYDMLLPVSGPGIALISKHSERFAQWTRPGPLPTPVQLAATNDKWAFFQALRNADIPVPDTVLVDSPSCLDAFDPETPVIVKPRLGSGGQGIVKFDHARDLRRRIQEFIGPGHPYIIQLYIEGPDVDRSVLCVSGKVLASTTQQPVTPQQGFAPSNALHFHRDARVEAVTDRLLAALDWNGIAHIDLRYTADGTPLVIELNPRYWSTLLGSLVAGINFPKAQVRSTMGFPPDGGTLSECHYVGLAQWPLFRYHHGTPLSHSSLWFTLADPLAKLMKRVNPSTALGLGVA